MVGTRRTRTKTRLHDIRGSIHQLCPKRSHRILHRISLIERPPIVQFRAIPLPQWIEDRLVVSLKATARRHFGEGSDRFIRAKFEPFLNRLGEVRERCIRIRKSDAPLLLEFGNFSFRLAWSRAARELGPANSGSIDPPLLAVVSNGMIVRASGSESIPALSDLKWALVLAILLGRSPLIEAGRNPIDAALIQACKSIGWPPTRPREID